MTKEEKRPWCLTSSTGVKNAARWRGSKIPEWCLLPPFEVGPTEISEHGSMAAPWIAGSSQDHISRTVLTWRVTPSLLSQRRRPYPKKQNLCSLNCWLGTKGGSSLPPCLLLFTVLFANDTMDMVRLWFLSWKHKTHFVHPCNKSDYVLKKKKRNSLKFFKKFKCLGMTLFSVLICIPISGECFVCQTNFIILCSYKVKLKKHIDLLWLNNWQKSSTK